MFLFKRVLSSSTFHKIPFIEYGTRRTVSSNSLLAKSYSCVIGPSFKYVDHINVKNTKCRQFPVLIPWHRKCYSKGLIDGDATEFRNKQMDKELKQITKIFQEPRVTLNVLASRRPHATFDIYYKQNVIAPKGARKKVQSNGWMCTYAFVWPEKAKFESSALSKRQAAEKSATQALHWLYVNKRIDNRGAPLYDKEVIDDLKTKLNKPLRITLSDASVEKIDEIWNDYESEIKNIYETAFQKASQNLLQTSLPVTKDSTVDAEEEFSEEEQGSLSEAEDVTELRVHIHPVYGKNILPPSEAAIERRDRVLAKKFLEYDENLLALPIDQYAAQIKSTLENSRVTLIVGAAGCGKSTRAPAAILRQCGATTSAIVSEPRRVAAIGLAERVANELGENVGETVGYQVRLQSKPPRPPAGSILYCTSGVLLRRLQLNPGLEGCTHVFIDEAHERDVNTDITLLLLKRALNLNPQLKVIIMSATLDTEVFTKYFDPCPVVEVPGQTFPVELFYLDDIQRKYRINLPHSMEKCTKDYDGKAHVNYREVAEVIKAVDKNEEEGAILVFLPGWSEIQATQQLLNEHYAGSSMHMILPVHSRLSTTDQTKMFTKPIPGIRKIVLATNIAETSITIPDVVYVIDSGAHKENRTKEGTGTATLETVWVSKAGAKQRTGRAGRVQLGQCYRLYTQEKEMDFSPHSTPEILRVPLVQTVLDCKTYSADEKVESFLSQLPEPPTRKSIQIAVSDLVDLGALTRDERLTRLGVLLSMMTLHPRLGRSVLNAAVIGNVVATANVVTHCATNVELFNSAADRRQEIREIKRKFNETSDHAALNWIQNEFEQTLAEKGWRYMDQWCDQYGIRKERLGFVRSLSNLHLEQLLKSGIIEPTADVQELNSFSEIDELTVAVLLSGSSSFLVTKSKVKTKGKLKTAVELFTSKGDKAYIGSESVNYFITKQNKTNLFAYFGGYHSTERRALIVHKTSLITPHMALLFCKGDIREETCDSFDDETTLSLSQHKWKIQIPTSQADRILKAKEMLWKTFDYYIERNIKELDYVENTIVSRFKVRLVKVIGRILVEADKELNQGKISKIIEDEELR